MVRSQQENLLMLCCNRRNIHHVMTDILQELKLSERSTAKCAKMVAEILRRQIPNVDYRLRNEDEYIQCVRKLNDYCVDKIVSSISKSYPHLVIKKTRQAPNQTGGRGRNHNHNQRLKRDLQLYPDQKNHVSERPVGTAFRSDYGSESESEHDSEDESKYGRMKNFGDGGCSYASASHVGGDLLADIPLDQRDRFRPKTADEMRIMTDRMLHERNYAGGSTMGGFGQSLATGDFGGHRPGYNIDMERHMTQGQFQPMNTGGTNFPFQQSQQPQPQQQASMMGGGFAGGEGIDMFSFGNTPSTEGNNFYSHLLGEGAPPSNAGNAPVFNQNTFMNPWQGQNNFASPFGGGGGVGGSMGGMGSMSDMANTAKAMQLQSEVERKTQERMMMDKSFSRM